MEQFRVGQRWISESEPELGLGTILQIGNGRIDILFPAAGEVRRYAIGNAPLKRVRFRAGDTIKTHDNKKLIVEAIREQDGLLTYVGEGRELPEAQLNDSISFQRPEDRLFAGQIDSMEDFELRRRTLQNQYLSRRSAARGFIGGRIDLIPHQLYIAQEISARESPRVLLSDEVGLGKTIEACLILHRLLLTGRVSRILVLVPESLVHQWFVEMLRRFNVWLHIFDEERCASIQAGHPDDNPFLDDQLVLASINFLAASPTRAAQAIAAGWDIIVVDEAHHLEWTPEIAGPKYSLVEALSGKSAGLLLLTATPEQLGQESHFARLKLLDPARYGDFEKLKSESGKYGALANLVGKVNIGQELAPDDLLLMRDLFKRDVEPVATAELLENLLDLHGPGRVIFRNTRAAMQGLPRRKALLIPLRSKDAHQDWVERVSTEFVIDADDSALDVKFELNRDPRIEWLAEMLPELAPAKVLLICRSKEKALAVDEALRQRINIKSSVFHEGLTLVERDRNAAYFADEDGARLLICSEIGSEGRNFQFAHHLVLFDLPLNPELLEQRIGRLDRIGQTEDIRIHVPYLEGSPQEVLARWYHFGLGALETSLTGANELLKVFGRQVHDLALEFPASARDEGEIELSNLITETSETRKALVQQLEEGRDRLLELNSFRPGIAQTIVDAVRLEDQDQRLEEYMLDIFDHFGVHHEELAPRTYSLNPEGVITEAFPSIPPAGLTATFERKRALGREDVAFLTWDHPIVTGAMDLVLDSEKGNASFAILVDPEERTLLIEALFIIEAVAASGLHIDRFLPATPLRIIVNHRAADVTVEYPEITFEKASQTVKPYKLLDNSNLSQKVLPAMIRGAHYAAETRAKVVIQESLQTMNRMMEHEIKRLKELREVNDHIRPEEILLSETKQQKFAAALQSAAVRLDSLRLIWKGPLELLV